jgi:hypothetical protein
MIFKTSRSETSNS